MVETTKTYRRPSTVSKGDDAHIQVTFDTDPEGWVYVGHWDENGDINEFRLTREDLNALVQMLTAATTSSHHEH